MSDETVKAPEASAPAAQSERPSGGPGSGPGGRPGGRPGGSGGPGGRGKFFRRKKVCKFCTEKIDAIPYRDVRLLQGFVAERGKIVHEPGSDLPYKAILTHDAGEDTQHAFATMREAEAFIKRNTPVPTARRTTYDRDAPGD